MFINAEVVGGFLALWMLRGSNRISHFPISIYSDSQAFIRLIGALRAKAGYHLVEQFINQAESLIEQADPIRKPEKIRLRWIIAHSNVLGNEHADKEAKKAYKQTYASFHMVPTSVQHWTHKSPVHESTKTQMEREMGSLTLKSLIQQH